MKRFLFVATLVLGGSVLAGCDKPTPDECRAAITNTERLLGTETSAGTVDNEGEIRRCRGGSSKEVATCRAKAKTVEELKACTSMSPKK